MSIEVIMNKFEKELQQHINDIFREEIDNNIIEIATNRDKPQSIIAQEIDSGEFDYKAIESTENWMIEIVRKTKKLKSVRVVIKSPDSSMMNRISDYQSIVRTLVEMAKNILNCPPFEKYVNQGVIQLADEEQGNVEFIPRDKL